MASFSKTLDFNFRRDHQKNFLWASWLWVGRRKKPILGYVPKKKTKKRIQEVKGWRKWELTNLFNPLPPSVPIWHHLAKLSILILEGIIKKNFLWTSQLWVGRRKEPILGYVPKNDEKNSGGKELMIETTDYLTIKLSMYRVCIMQTTALFYSRVFTVWFFLWPDKLWVKRI